MHSIITSYLLQTNKCALPYIGLFNTEYIPAESDVANEQILPPKEEIYFREETILLSSGLISYIAQQKNITEGEAGNLLDSFCKMAKEKIDKGERLSFDNFGYLQKNDSGTISFTNEHPSTGWYQAVPAVKALHEIEPEILITEKEITFVAKGDHSEEAVGKKRWQVLALLLAAFALLVLALSFYHNFPVSATGNRNQLIIKDAGETHFDLSK